MSWLLIVTAVMAILAMITGLMSAVQHYRNSAEMEAKLVDVNIRLRRIAENIEAIEEELDNN